MTEPGSADPLPGDPQPVPGAGAPAQGLPSWTSQLTSTAPVAGPAGLYYADVPNRAIAYIIDAIIGKSAVGLGATLVTFNIRHFLAVVGRLSQVVGLRLETRTGRPGGPLHPLGRDGHPGSRPE